MLLCSRLDLSFVFLRLEVLIPYQLHIAHATPLKNHNMLSTSIKNTRRSQHRTWQTVCRVLCSASSPQPIPCPQRVVSQELFQGHSAYTSPSAKCGIFGKIRQHDGPQTETAMPCGISISHVSCSSFSPTRGHLKVDTWNSLSRVPSCRCTV